VIDFSVAERSLSDHSAAKKSITAGIGWIRRGRGGVERV
jgi:hypothetical protein